MLNLALWLKRYGFKADQVQAFYPSPMATATTMYHTGKNPLRKVTYKSDPVESVKDPAQRKLHKAFLRYHDSSNWPLLREALTRMGRTDLIGEADRQLIPKFQPKAGDDYQAQRRKNTGSAHTRRTAGKKILTQHTGLPPRDNGASNKRSAVKKRKKK